MAPFPKTASTTGYPINPELEKTNAYWKIPNFESDLIKIFKQNATIVDTPNITIDTKRRERIFGIISLSN